MRLRQERARLRVGLAPGLAGHAPGSGHGNVWHSVLAELRQIDGVRLVGGGRADVWLANGHDPPPDGRPLVVQVHEASWGDERLRAFLAPEFVAGIEAQTRAALAAAEHVITPSHASAQQVLETYRLPRERVHAVHHGVDHTTFRPDVAGGRELVGAPYVLFVGVLHPRKNLAAVREAVGDLAQAGLPHVLAIVGNPAHDPNAERFEAEARAELPGHPGRIVHLRDVRTREMVALMAGTDVLCLPSYFEGFGLPVLEAMACGAPVLVSDRGALPEVVGDGGLVVAPEGAAVSRGLRRLVSERALAQRLRAAAVERAAGFSWRTTAEGWLQVLRRAA